MYEQSPPPPTPRGGVERRDGKRTGMEGQAGTGANDRGHERINESILGIQDLFGTGVDANRVKSKRRILFYVVSLSSCVSCAVLERSCRG